MSSFVGGMNMDADVSVIKNNSYRYAENIELISNESGTATAIQGIEGMLKLNNTPIQFNYYEYDISTDSAVLKTDTLDSKYNILGLGVIRDYVCIFTRSDDGLLNQIFRLRIIDDVIHLTRLVEGYFNINDGEDRDLSIVTYWEDFDNIKVYWSDGFNSLRSINIAESNDLINYNKTPSFFDNNITINLSKPTFDSFIPGSLKAGMVQYAYQMFDVNGAETSISPLSDMIHLTRSNAHDINYKGSDADTVTGKTCKIRFEVLDEKFSKCKIYRIHYSVASDLPKIYTVGEFDVSTVTINNKSYQYFSDNGSVLEEITYEEFLTRNPYYFIPKVIESKDGRLFSANIIEDTWSLPDHTSDEWYDTRAFRFGYNTTDGYHAKLTSLNNDDKIIKYSDIIGMTLDQWKKLLPYNHDCINPINYDFSEDLKRDTSSYEWYYDGSTMTQKGGIGRNVSFRIVHTKFGEDYYENNSLNRSQFLDKKVNDFNSHVRDVNVNNTGIHSGYDLDMYYNIVKPTDSNYENPNYQNTENVDYGSLGALNYSNPFLDAKYRSYQRDEIYRFGVVFYNKKGQTTPVNWIADIRMPSMSEYNHRLFDQWDRIRVAKDSAAFNTYQIVTYPMGLQFEFRNIPADVDQIEIVRCQRTRDDRRILAQGLISRTGKSPSEFDKITNKNARPLFVTTWTNALGQYYVPGAGYYNNSDDVAWVASNAAYYGSFIRDSKDTLTFTSPEISYFGESFNVSDRIRSIDILYGLSSPTKLNNWWSESNIYIKEKMDEANELLAHVYNTNQFFKGTAALDNALISEIYGTDNKYRFAGQIGKFKGGDKTMWTVGWYSKGGQDGTYVDEKSICVAKMYSPFTYYYGHNMIDGGERTINIYEYKNKLSATVDDAQYAEALSYDSYEDVVSGLHTISVGSTSYQNWSIDKTLYGYKRVQKSKHGGSGPLFVINSSDINNKLWAVASLGTTPSDIQYSRFYDINHFDIPFVRPSNNTSSGTGIINANDMSECYSFNSTFLVNVCQITNPYGGFDYNSRSNSTYISTNATSIIDANNLSLTVFGGDTYIGITEQINNHWYYLKSDPIPGYTDAFNKAGEKVQMVLYYPCESSINLSMVHGDNFYRYANTGSYPNNIQVTAYSSIDNFVQSKNLYAYNSIYSVEPTGSKFLPKGIYTEDNKHFDFRVLWSDKKTNDEISDSWLKFKVANYLDLDTRFGSINNLKLFNNSLYFWQDDAFGELPVNERSLITDNNNAQLILGKGDVLSYYKYITQSNGSRKNVINNVVTSPSSLYWYDHDRAEIMSLSGSLVPLTKSRNVQSWFNTRKDSISDRVIALYDKKYNRVQFRFLDDDQPTQIVFSEAIDAFTCFLTYKSDWFIDLKDNYYSIKSNNIFKHNADARINKFFYNQENSKISYVINDAYTNTKVFDNIEYYGEFDNNNLEFVFNTTTQNSSIITKDNIDKREDTYKFAIPRSSVTSTNYSDIAPIYNDRMRGKYLISHVTFRPNNGDVTFKVPYIKTAYRISNI